MGRRRNNINAAVWLIGIGILWLTDLWWPGILILVGISLLVQVAAPQVERASPAPPTEAPLRETAAESEEQEYIWQEEVEETAETPVFMRQSPERDESLLPEQCPACGGPVAENAHKVEWAGPRTAKCPFCDTILNL